MPPVPVMTAYECVFVCKQAHRYATQFSCIDFVVFFSSLAMCSVCFLSGFLSVYFLYDLFFTLNVLYTVNQTDSSSSEMCVIVARRSWKWMGLIWCVRLPLFVHVHSVHRCARPALSPQDDAERRDVRLRIVKMRDAITIISSNSFRFKDEKWELSAKLQQQKKKQANEHNQLEIFDQFVILFHTTIYFFAACLLYYLAIIMQSFAEMRQRAANAFYVRRCCFFFPVQFRTNLNS